MLSVIAIITSYVPPEKLGRSRPADQHLVAGDVVGRIDNKDARAPLLAVETAVTSPIRGSRTGAVRVAKNSLSAHARCRSRLGNDGGYPQRLPASRY